MVMVQERRSTDVSVFVGRYPRRIQQLVTMLRRLIRKSVPDVTETFTPRTNQITYRVREGNKSHYFCYIAPTEDRVRLGFEFGSLLADPHHLLDGKGKRVRHVDIKKSTDVVPDEVGMMIAEAALVAVNNGHAIM